MINGVKIEDAKGDTNYPDINCKVILIGETGAGKTCIMLRASKDEFKEEHTVTLGADFLNYYISLDKKLMKMQIWDTCGLEMYKSMIRVFFKGSDAALLIFDVSSQKSFDMLSSWLKELREYTDPNMPCYLVGNKIDLPTRTISRESAEAFARQSSLAGYYETSAKLGQGIRPLIHAMALNLYHGKAEHSEGPAGIELDSKPDANKGKGKGKGKGGCSC